MEKIGRYNIYLGGKLLEQLLIILGLTYTCELIVDYTGLPIPGSVLGMLILFVLLRMRIIKLSSVESSANTLLNYLPLMFVPLGVGIYKYIDVIQDCALELIFLLVITTVFVMVTSGWTVQFIKRKGKNRDVV